MSDEQDGDPDLHGTIEPVAGKVTMEVVKSLIGPAGILMDIGKMALDEFVGDGTKRLQAAVQEEIADGVLRRLPEVERRVEALAATGTHVSATDFARVLEAYAKAQRNCADAKKRKVLEEALVNSFDPELYESGLLVVLWEKLDRLSYGDLWTLSGLAELDEGAGVKRAAEKSALFEKYGMTDGTRGSSLSAFHQSNLMDEGLSWSSHKDGHGPRITELGTRLCRVAPLGDEQGAVDANASTQSR